ncbi:hypothetical protein GGTG_00283 [Gaeumannomyces tritici R3-111a-1]|uniref:C2H2-type domain-containing protein n=1 Tax=Gaeumannomyces tritici (strain R3-111a-1) TaxID=644352 RepID=J3NG91_GAET3|nr:hypothetical protein GGTG_00283 [Gaeumannomyces tritici R3-111a-1]EJT80281.1 hypothetical protein GGTG_00283 [Gaeumannomyces tritici R3-111a-1]
MESIVSTPSSWCLSPSHHPDPNTPSPGIVSGESDHIMDPPFRSRKRPLDEINESQEGVSVAPNDLTKRIRKGGSNLACPFRKRNPRKFNFRDRPACTSGCFDSLPLLKRHIETHHGTFGRSRYTCDRCHASFATSIDRAEHSRRDPPCACQEAPTSAPPDPEDGITERALNVMMSRSPGNRVSSWGDLWNLLFPGDSTVPSSGKATLRCGILLRFRAHTWQD